MSDYRRLISYIYAYEGGVKGRNIGFAKIEARGGQCKIQVSVRRIYMGGQDVGVYLLAADREIVLGKIFLRGGSGEFRVTVPYDNVSGSGYSMDQCYGLTIHGADDAWRCYTTIWEDAVAHAAAVELEEATSANAEAREMENVPAAEITEKNLADMDGSRRESVTESIERELAGEIPRPEKPAEVPAMPQPEKPANQPSAEAPAMPQPEKPANQPPAEAPSMPQPEKPADRPPAEVPAMPLEKPADRPPAEVPAIPRPEKPAVQPPKVPRPEIVPAPRPEEPAEAPRISQPDAPSAPQEISGQPDAQFPLPESADQPERDDISRLWSHFKRHYPKIQAFDYHGGCEILLIKPQDIGLLPRETWSYGNNSFLLHGYYNHRYLILARLSSPDGAVRFLLGVPGHYYSNEKYMASMFGFPNFVLSKMQPAGDGRFGYWYTDIRLTEAGTGSGRAADQ